MNSLILISPSKGEAFNQFFLVRLRSRLWAILYEGFPTLWERLRPTDRFANATPVPVEEYGIIEPRRREGHEGREKKK